MADALTAPTRGFSTFTVEVSASTEGNRDVTANNQPARLSISSRELVRKSFRDVTPIRLPQGHPVIALNQEQISCVLKAVADETAKASFDMLSSVVTRASQLNLGVSGGKSNQQVHRPFSTYSATSASDTEFISDGGTTLARSETTRGRQSDDEFWNI